jgi:hypothetical protein
MINVYGVDPHTGFARRPIDNVGIQYGLKALNAGTISFEQFVDLNNRIGGYDIDGNYVSQRTHAEPTALSVAYKTGRINNGKALATIPIIDSRAYRESVGDVHDAVRSHVMRARLLATNGRADNQVIVVADSTLPFMPNIYFDYIMIMDEWLSNIARDDSPAQSVTDKVVRNKPAGLVDACHIASGQKITDPAVCAQLYPTSLEPRLAAGEPLTNDRLKCALKPVDARDYAIALTTARFTTLQTVFPEGVCDYSKPGVEQQPPVGTWLSYPTPGSFLPLR